MFLTGVTLPYRLSVRRTWEVERFSGDGIIGVKSFEGLSLLPARAWRPDAIELPMQNHTNPKFKERP